jgi:catechol 2,3-dioxygenase-like lactoylglutathione lyase family enzyme
MAISAKLPSRLHHTAYTSKDLEATRHFYEDIIGLPLVATWCEKDELFGKAMAARWLSSSSPTRRTRSCSRPRYRLRPSITLR